LQTPKDLSFGQSNMVAELRLISWWAHISSEPRAHHPLQDILRACNYV